MEGYIISFEVDNTEGSKILYWAGASFTEDVLKSQFYTNAIEARQVLGGLQSQYIDRTAKLVPAKNGVHF